MKIFGLPQLEHHHLLNGGGPDDEWPPDGVLHLLDAGVHVVQGDSSGSHGAGVGAAGRQVLAGN